MINTKSRSNQRGEPTEALALLSALMEGGTAAESLRVFSRDRLSADALTRAEQLHWLLLAALARDAKGNTMSEGSQLKQSRPIRFLRLAEVLQRVGVSKMSINRWEPKGEFPRRRKIGCRTVAWVEAEIDDWCEKRAAGLPWGGE